MKKLTLIFIAFIGAASAQAQNINPENDHNTSRSNLKPKPAFKRDSLLSNWVLDVNLTGGLLFQDLKANNPSSNYLNAVNSNISDVTFTKGTSAGIDAEIGYFFNRKKHWGIGTGLWYMRQTGDVNMENFHVEYQSTDYAGNIYRQLITANGAITETQKIDNFNIPLLLKYKTRLSRQAGFTFDAGLMFNLVEQSKYNGSASFDYEAIYKASGSGSNVTTVYDNAAIPGPTDLLITKNQYLSTHSAGSVNTYFNTLRAQGNNVGLNVRSANNSGKISYKSGSVGFLVRPAVNFFLSDNVALNFGVYYLYQNFAHSASGNYKVTDKVGEYNSALNSVSKAANQSFGVNLGVRFFLHKAKEVQVAETAPAVVEEEKEVAVVPPAPEPEEDTADITPVVDVSTPILFDHDRNVIKKESYPILEEAVSELHDNKKASVEIHGYTDNTGSAAYNAKLSLKRAAAVKSYLNKKGVNPKSIKTIGHGSKYPAASNKTAEGRARNRRAVMKLK